MRDKLKKFKIGKINKYVTRVISLYMLVEQLLIYYVLYKIRGYVHANTMWVCASLRSQKFIHSQSWIQPWIGSSLSKFFCSPAKSNPWCLMECCRASDVCIVVVYLCFFFFLYIFFIFFFFNDTATTEIYTLSLHDALPISATL